MYERTDLPREGPHAPDPARQAKRRLAERGKRRRGRQALAQGERWRRGVLGAMISAVALVAALQFAASRPAPQAPGHHFIHDQTRNTMTRQLPRIFVSTPDFERLMARLDALPSAEADRLQGLADELDRADVRDPRDMPAGVVAMGSTVRFAIGPTAGDLTLTLVYPDEVDGQADRISVFAPVGSALLGLQAGARIEWPRPDGARQVITIREVG